MSIGIRYVYVNFRSRCVLIGTISEISDSLRFEDLPGNRGEYTLKLAENPKKELDFWSVFKITTK